jgi:isopenicillin N synthase-like dioxygenase
MSRWLLISPKVHDVYVLAQKMVQIFSLALGLEEIALDKFFETPLTDITINHYLPNPEATEYEQVLFPHADYGGKWLLSPTSFSPADILTDVPHSFHLASPT